MKDIIRFIFFGLLAPILLVVGGALITGWGLTNDWPVLIWGGIIILGVGILWAILVLFWSGALQDFF